MTLPGLAPVTLREHVPDTGVHVAGEGKVTLPVPEDQNSTAPLGEDPPETVAVQELAAPAAKDVGVQETVVVALACVTVRSNVPGLPKLLESPAYVA